MGDIAQEILDKASCPVLVVRQKASIEKTKTDDSAILSQPD